MINDFLTRLDNRNTSFEGIVRPSYDVEPYTGDKLIVWNALFGGVNSLEHFRTAVEIVSLLRMTPLSEYETLLDDRLTYNGSDLARVLTGSGDSVETESSASASLVIGPGSNSRQTWAATVTGANEVTSTDDSGITRVVSGVTFAADGSSLIPLANSGSYLQVFGSPNLNDSWNVSRDANYNSRLAGMVDRLNSIPDGVLARIASDQTVRDVLRNRFALINPVTVAVAAIGIVHG